MCDKSACLQYSLSPAAMTWRRGRARGRRRGTRRYPGLSHPYVKTHVLLNPSGASLVPRTPPTIEELLGTIRDAWPAPRSLSLDSKKREKSRPAAEVMGTGSKMNTDRTPKIGLPYRRYSVPEIVMRKYSLSRTQTSGSEVLTVPTPSVPSIGTSQDSNIKRMSNKACQTSPPDSASATATQSTDKTSDDNATTSHSLYDDCGVITIPSVNIIPSVNFNLKPEEDIISKHSSTSTDFGQCEEISDFAMSERRVFGSELSLPGAVNESNLFLMVPKTLVDPHDIPKEINEEDDELSNDIIKCTVTSPSLLDSKKSNLLSQSHEEDKFSNFTQTSPKKQRKSMLSKNKSNSAPESPDVPLAEMKRRSSSADGLDINLSNILSSEELNIDNSFYPENTPTPAHCHEFDTQGNMSECYITDCDMCNAEGRKCCSLDDSGSQSCSFTSPEMVSSNDLKSSSDYMTSSITLDQTVSDRTISTQDSTISLTSITPESGITKSNYVNISPILVIQSEETILDKVTPRNKARDTQLFHPSESSTSEDLAKQTKPNLKGSEFPLIISCESGVVPEIKNEVILETEISANMKNKKDMETQKQTELPGQNISEPNNNTIYDTTLRQQDDEKNKSDKNENPKHGVEGQKKNENYSTNYLYLTEDESGANPDSLETVGFEETDVQDHFEIDSLAINESTSEDSNLLENLGFCEDLSKVQYPPCNLASSVRNSNEIGSAKDQETFYGNTTYEIITKENIVRKSNFKANVMQVLEEKNFKIFNNDISKKSQQNPEIKIETDDFNEDISMENGIRQLTEETSMGSVAGGTYWDLPDKELVVPRFSALPRTLSMIVNTSSMDCSSDSDLSLPDSLEDNKKDDSKSRGLKLFHKYDNRLVRGDVIALLPEENGGHKKGCKGAQAYFLSLTGEEGEIRVEKIPDEIRQKLAKRNKLLKKTSEHLVGHVKKIKEKVMAKKVLKQLQHCCASTNTESSPKISEPTTEFLSESGGKISKCTQWEELGSSKESSCSDTLVPSEGSDKDKETIAQDLFQAKDASTSPFTLDTLQNSENSKINCWLESVSNNFTNDGEEFDIKHKDFSSNLREGEISNENRKTHVNKWIQCEDMPHMDSALDKEISKLIIDSSNEVNEMSKEFKCVEHQVPWAKHICTQVSDNDLLFGEKNNFFNENGLQTKDTEYLENKFQHNEIASIELDLSYKESSNVNTSGNNLKLDNGDDDDDDNRCKTPVFGERPLKQTVNEKVLLNKHSKFNMKSNPSRRSSNLSTRFKQKFEVIPEEKSGSLESSNDEKTPIPHKGRRASMPSEIILRDMKFKENKSSDSSNSSNDKPDHKDYNNVRNVPNSQGEGHRRHTIHGNLASRNSKADSTNHSFDKNEQSRRHTIHGTLSPKDSMLKELNLLGGTLLKGRVFGKQSGVMFGRFRPVNEETQVQKDERSLVEEHLERLRRDATKGREALAVAKTDEQDELMTLSKGWINFYLLRDSQEMASDGSCVEEDSQDLSEEKLRRAPPAMKTVTVVGKPEEEVKHQYTVQIHASPEDETRLPNLDSHRHSKHSKSPLASPDLTLPDITPASSPACSPPARQELPHIHSKSKRKTDKCKHSSKNLQEKQSEKAHSLESDQNLRYLKLSSVKQELQTEKTYFARSGEIACSELSPESKSSSSSVTADSPTLPSIKWPSRQLSRRHSRYSRTQPTPPLHPQQACWTVTLAGSSGNLTQPPPDVEMRLSFSNTQPRAAINSQSDSGLGEDGPNERVKKQQALPPAVAHNNQWKVMLKTQQDTDRSEKLEKRTVLPEFNFTPSTARSKSKRRGQEESGPLAVKVQEVLEHNVSLHKSSVTEGEWVEGLSVTGLAITPERKPRVPTMSERDLTRQWYHRARIDRDAPL